MKPSISIVLFRKRQLADGRYPVKLQAAFRMDAGRWVQKYYKCKDASGKAIAVTEEEFSRIMDKPRNNEERTIRQLLLGIEKQANDLIKPYEVVTAPLFERLLGAGSASHGVLARFDQYIAELRTAGRVGNMTAYQTARNTLEKFAGGEFRFYEVTQGWLEKFARWMREKERSETSTSIYLRALRKIFNDAIELKLISPEHYPFGRRRFTIQSQRKPKTPLTEDQKNQLLKFRTEDPLLRKAVDFFLLSYFCNGVNFNDVLRWRRRNLQEGVIVFKRGKTERTARMVKPIVVVMRKEVEQIIARHGAPDLSPAAFVFPVLRDDMSPEEQREAVQAFTKQVNAGLKVVGKDLKPPVENLTSYTARHTFANISLLKGASKEFIQEALGHQSIMTTESYISGFDLQTKKRMAGKL